MTPQPTSTAARRWRHVGFAVALGLLALLPAAAVGQPQFLDPPPLGTQLFQNFLNGFGLQPLASLDELAAKDPSETVLVVFRDLNGLNGDQLARFVDQGGAVLFASDQPDRGRLAPFGLQISGKRALAPHRVVRREEKNPGAVWLVPPGGDGIAPEGLKSANKRDAEELQRTMQYSGPQEVKELNFGGTSFVLLTADCWKTREAEPYGGLDTRFGDCMVVKGYVGSSHPIFAGCDKGLVVDQPSYLNMERPDLRMLCSLPPFWATKEPSGPFKGEPIIIRQPGFIAGSSGKLESKERILVLAGHSLFLNCALAQDDLDNATFAMNALTWLTDSKRRKFCLLLNDSQAVTKFDVPLMLPPIPTARMINDFLRALEEENFFNRILLDHVAKQRILRTLATMALVGLAVYGFRRVGLARHRQDSHVPLIEAKLARLVGDSLPQLARRRQHALRGNDFREAARVVARECFESSHPGRLPAQAPVPVGGDLAALQKAVARLWQLAHAAEAQPLPAEAFSRIVEMARQVKAALALGTVRWTSRGTS